VTSFITPPAEGDIHYGTGHHGSIDITQSNVLVTADAGATFDNITLKNVNNVELRSLTLLGYVDAPNTHYATNCIVRDCTALGVHLNTGRIDAGATAPSGWLIEYNDLIGGGMAVLVKSHDPNDYPVLYNTTVRYNKIGNMDVDAIQAGNYDGLTIHKNEIYGCIEDGNHSDGFQTVWGGTNLTITENYLHDNNCQTFHIKEGFVDNITLADNLSIRNREGNPEPVIANLWEVADMDMYNNTFWDSSAWSFRDGGDGSQYPQGTMGNIEMYDNVINSFTPFTNTTYFDTNILNEHDNVFGGGWNWIGQGNEGPGTILDTDPDFDDWMITGAGITWQPTGRLYGRAAYT